MSRQRLAVATWIACCAVLFNLLAMPISGAMASSPDRSASEQLLWGSFCSASGTKLVAIAIGKLEQNTPPNDDHSTMQHCWCCSGSAPLVALPGHIPQLAVAGPQSSPGHFMPPVDSPTPRQQWPSLNPRASPDV
ncbi:DUF2946 domain-containing protein [Pseudomonas gingeri]|uniref:DUF2946 domain-containing protein n=1 Tax=Pseudomonas gingeri TaxID=117681 RepID=UPI0015A07405|nr:DUF2946 domain-containing protein [Pseudomonas gingeri]NWD09177.1 DUF2946 domain-containing protein [Pseudomonas gingeri]NWD50058.1 DUF2946 domain-containing protein [Pseudomonas gingeri]NWE34980.1 DUF2946 domain-containing protein [Pseudomonas gingeri]NWE60780.1 DUF2946 domain-containing protein [Pseudomonas gingeri]NWF01141.1 DUF2946 domain-containing protein [Pseudomonas gingeri]